MNNQTDSSVLQRAADDIEFHWGEILRLQQEIYDRLTQARITARDCDKLLNQVERITQPSMRMTPPSLEAVRGR